MRTKLFALLAVVWCSIIVSVSPQAAAQQSSPSLTPIFPRGWLAADRDSKPDRLVRDPGWRHDGPVYGRVLVVSGATGGPSRILVGQEAGDLFGISACPMGDLTGDGIDEIAVGAPGAYLKTDGGMIPRGVGDDSILPERYGRVVLFDGSSGLVLATFAGSPTEFFGFGICRIADTDADGVDDMIVLSVMPDPTSVQSRPLWRYTVQSTASGAVVSTGPATDLPAILGSGWHLGLWNAENPAHVRKRQVADLNADGVVDGADLLEVLGNLGQSGGNIGRGDVDLSGVITPEDVAGIIQEYGAASPPEYLAVSSSANAVPCRRSGGPNPRCPMCYLAPGGCSDPGGGDGGGGDGSEGGDSGGGSGPGGGEDGTTRPPGFDDPGGEDPPTNCGGAAIRTDILTDSNNDGLINQEDESVETDAPGRLIALFHEEGGLPRDVGQVQVRAVPTGANKWRVTYPVSRLAVFAPGVAEPITPGVWRNGTPPSNLLVHGIDKGSAYLTLDCQTPECGIRSDVIAITCIDPQFEIDDAVQPEDDSYLAVLPADASEVLVTHGVGGTPPLVYTLSLADAGFINEDGETVETLPAEDSSDLLRVYSPKTGTGYIQLRRGSTTGQIIARFPFEVGGKIAVRYNYLPTFKVTQSGGPVIPVIGPPNPGPIAASGGLSFGGGPFVYGGRGTVRPAAHEAANAVAARNATAKVEIRDARDNPIGNKSIRLIARHRRIEPANGGGGGPIDLAPINNGFTAETDRHGVATIDLAANSQRALEFYNNYPTERPNVPWSELSMQVEQVGVFVGLSGEVERLPNSDTRDALFNTQNLGLRNLKHKAGAGFTMDTSLTPSEREDKAWAFQTFQIPLVNHTHYMVLRGWLDAPALVHFDDPGTIVTNISVWDTAGDNLVEEQLELSYAGLLSSLTPDQRQRILDSIRAHADFPIEASNPPNDSDSYMSILGGAALSVGEFGFGFVPIVPDLIDFGKELIWQPIVNDQRPNYWVVGFSAFGLAADAGYLVLPAGVVGNATANVGKFIARLDQRFPGLIANFIRLAGDVRRAAQMIADYAARIPAPPNTGVLGHAQHMAATIVRQIARVITLPDIAMDRAVEALTLVWKRTGGNWSDDAVEGVGRLCKRCFPNPTTANGGCGDLAETIMLRYGDDIAQDTMSLVRRIPLDSPPITPDAIEGIAVSLKAVGTNNRHIVDELIQGTQMSAERLGKALSGIKSLDGTEGLDDLVTFVRNNRNNATGVDGVIFEVTAARRIRSGELAAAGGLTRVSADGLPDANRLDTLSANWAIQVKHQRSESHIGVGSFGGSDALPESAWPPGWSAANGPYRAWMQYLDQLATQSAQLQRFPAIIINRNPTPELQAALQLRGIAMSIIPD